MDKYCIKDSYMPYQSDVNLTSEKPEHIREWNFDEFGCYIKKSGFEILKHFHQYPLKLSLQSWKVYIQIFRQTFFAGDGMKFKYNQVLVCKIKKQ